MNNAVAPASEKQLAFLQKLVAERVPRYELPADLDSLDKIAASGCIEMLLDSPRKPVSHQDGEAVGPGYYLLDGEVFKVVKARAGHFYAKQFVKAAKPCPGHLDHSDPSAFDAPFVYCAQPCGSVAVSWDYAPGALRKLAGAERLTAAQAGEMGKACGHCIICAKLLTDPKSVAAGIGPVCAGKLGY